MAVSFAEAKDIKDRFYQEFMCGDANYQEGLYIHGVHLWHIGDYDPEAPAELRDEPCILVVVEEGPCPSSIIIPEEYQGLRVYQTAMPNPVKKALEGLDINEYLED